jgi:hypothetical protein
MVLRRSASLALILSVGVVAAALSGCGGSAGGSADPGSVAETGALSATFVPFALPTATATKITWNNTVGDTVYTIYYSGSLVTGLTVSANGVVWNNGSTPAGNFAPPYQGGLFINTTSKVVTLSGAEITRNVQGSAPATVTGTLNYQ